ncbi:actin cytoskeleton-regulatory complex protein [Tanacetum coccineum]
MDTSSDYDRENKTNEDVDAITFGFNQKIDLVDAQEQIDHEEHDNDDDFTFILVGEDDQPIDTDKAFEDGQIFPLFDQKLLNDHYHIEEINHLPMHPHVDKLFIESPRGFPPSTSAQHDEDSAAGPYCEWSKNTTSSSSSNSSSTSNAEMSKKSNSTGFSKLWRLKEKVGRSNSDGRDAFVFLKHNDKTAAATTPKAGNSDGIYVKVNDAGGKPRVVKAKKASVSAHEAYMKSRGHTEDDRRKSYLPYRPELMGFFTNVHGGLSKNVHPY